VDVLPVISLTPAGPYCQTNPDVTLSFSPAGGNWTGTGIVDAAAGIFSPATAGPGNHVLTYTVNSGACNVQSQITVHVDANVDANFTAAGPLCQYDNAVTLSAVTAGGTWSGTGIINATIGIFDPEIAGPGLHTITYAVSVGTCSDTQTENILVDAAINASITPPGPFCITDAASNLSSLNPGGTWSGTGITDVNTGLFDPATAGAGGHEIVYQITSGSCISYDTVTVWVYNTVVDAEISPVATQCISGATIIMTAVTPGGTWSGTGIINASTGEFNPGIAGSGNHIITYSVGNIACFDSDNETISVDDTLSAVISPAGPFCENEAAINLTAATAGGTWTGTGITNAATGTFDPGIAAQGDHNITYQINNGACTNSDNISIHVDDIISAAITPAGPFCADALPVSLTAAGAGGLWAGTGITNTATGVFNPGVAGSGNHIITYTTLNGECSDNDTETIHVDAIPNAGITPAGPFCSDAAPLNLTAATAGGTWSGTGITNTVTGTFAPGIAGAGNHIISYTVLAGACSSTGTTTLHVDAAVDASITPAGPFCENQTAVTLSAASAGGTWSGTGIINPTTGLFNPILAGNGSHTISYSVSNGVCSDNASVVIVVDDNPNSTITPAGPFCANQAPVNLTAATPGGTWAGTGITNPATGTFSPVVAGVGVHNITYTVGNGACTSTSSANLTVSSVVNATISPAGPFCETQAAINLTAVSPAGTWSGTGITSAILGTFNPGIAGPGNHTITYSVTNGGCSDSDTEIIHVDDYEVPVISGSTNFCENDSPINFSSSIAGGVWSGNGITNSGTGAFNPGIAGEGTHIITYTLTNGMCTSNDDITVIVSDWLDATISPAGPFCQTEATQTLSAASAGGLWSGTGIINTTTGAFNPGIAGPGTHAIIYTISNGNCTDDDTTFITVSAYPVVTITSTGPYCQTTGSVTLNATPAGGIWSGTGITNPATGLFTMTSLTPGVYTVNYTFTQGACSASDDQNIQVYQAVDATISGPASFCETNSQVNLSAVSPGGTWSGTGIVNTLNGTFNPATAGPGIHTITYTVSNGPCTDSDQHVITVYDNPEPQISGPVSACINQSTIDFGVNLSGGSWSGPGIINVTDGIFDPSVAGTGNHQIVFTISNGNCLAFDTHNITVNNTTNLSITNADTEFCLNEPSVVVVVSPAGGVLSGNGITGNQFNPAAAGIGTHTITYSYTNLNGCSSVVTKLFTVHALPVASFSGINNHYCLNDGSSVLVGLPAGGVFSGDGIGGSTFNPQTAGTGMHEIIYVYTDGFGCRDTAEYTTIVYPVPEVTTDNLTEPLCYGNANGSIYISVSSGLSPYSYTWSNTPSSTTQDLLNVVAGNYSVTVSDSRGCTHVAQFNLLQPDQLLSTPVVLSNASCFGYENGSAMVNVSGGTEPYTYQWNTPNGGTGSSVNNIPAGNWSVLVTDDNGCNQLSNFSITQPENISMTIANIGHVSCFGGNNGFVNIGVTGGTMPYTYLWDDESSSTGPSVNNLSAGTYHVTITDDHLCTSIQQVVINEPNAIVPGASIQHVNCGTSPGSITLLPQGGTAPFTYLWSTGAVTNAITGLSAGYYEVSITDFNGCTFHDGFQIMASGSNPVVISQTGQILCFGDATGSLSGSMPNGTPLFTYQWSTGGNTAVITGLVAGEYNLTITDAWGCTGSSGKTIDQPGQLNAAVTTVPVSCYGDATGSAQVAISGGVPPYYAAWSSGQSGYQIINMLAGNYQVSVSDHNQCVEVIDFTIAQPSAPLSVLLNITPISCYQDTDGEINAVAQGGTPPYNYYWYNGTSFVNLSTIRFLGQGVYNVTVTDAKGCSTDSLVFLAQPRPLIASYTTTDPSCIGNYDGSILVAVTGGTEPYIYEMNGISYPSSPIDSLYQGDYTVNVVDAHGCEYLLSDIHLEDTFRDCLIIPNAFTPNGDGINDEWVIGNIHLFPRAYIQVFNRWGQILYEGLATEGFWDGTHDGLPVPTGPYMYAIDLLTGANPYIGIVTVVH